MDKKKNDESKRISQFPITSQNFEMKKNQKNVCRQHRRKFRPEVVESAKDRPNQEFSKKNKSKTKTFFEKRKQKIF